MTALSRRRFIQGTTMAALATHPISRALAAELNGRHLLLVGTATGRSGSKGVYKYAFDSKTGALEQLDVTECNNPQFMALSADQKYLYTLNSGFLAPGQAPPPPPQPGQRQRGGGAGGGGAVSSWAFNNKTGAMTLINEVSSGGGGGVYICVDHTGTCVFTANYGSGSAQSFKVGSDGKLSEIVDNIKFPPAENDPKKTSHAHRTSVSPGNKYMLVNDLGLDKIHIFKFDVATAKLTPAGEWLSAPGAGPRALRWHPNKKIAYIVNELAPTVTVASWDEKEGKLTTLQDVRMVPDNYTAPEGKACAPGDIVFDKKWEHAYVTSRLDDFMGNFKVEKDFKLTFLERTTSGGVRERDCTLDPTDNWLLVANPDSNNIAVMRRDQKTGLLSNTVTTSVPLGQSMCLIFPARPNVTFS